MAVRGWKCFDKDLKAHTGYQFAVGKSYEVSGKVVMCQNGFHFHRNGWQLFNYYKNERGTRICEVVAHDALSDTDKSVCGKIEIVRELSFEEICQIFGMPEANGYGYGDGYGYGNGDGNGVGYGYGNGDGNGYGYGYGNGDGDGNGYGYGKYYFKLVA